MDQSGEFKVTKMVRGKVLQTITYNGQTKTYAEWAAFSGIAVSVLRKRVEAGNKDFLGPLMVRQKAVATVYGEPMTLYDISDIFEIPYATLLGWRQKGFDFEEKIEERKELNASKLEAQKFPQARR